MGADSHVAVVGEGGQLARARVHDEGTGVRIDFEVPTAPVPPRLEAELVHAVFELGALRARRPLLATVPSGASQVLEDVRRHVADCRTRVAGSTCLVQGVVR